MDGHRFVEDVMRRGAAGIISELERPADFSGAWLRVADARAALAQSAAVIHGDPSAALDLVVHQVRAADGARRIVSVSEVAERLLMTEAEVEAALARAVTTLAKIRASRPRPHRDDKVLTAWNGLMVAAFARAIAVEQPALATEELEKPLTMLLFGMINWLFTWFQHDGRISYGEMAELVTAFVLGGLRQTAKS